MTLATKILLAFAGLVVAVGLAGWKIHSSVQQAFDQVDQERAKAVLAQFRQLLAVSSAEIHQQIDQAISSNAVQKLLISTGNPTLNSDAASRTASAHRFDFLDLVGDNGSVVSCAHWPERVGSKNLWVMQSGDWQLQKPFLRFVEDPKGGQLGLVAVRMITAGDHQFWVIAGRSIGQEFLAALVAPLGIRVLLYLNPGASSMPTMPIGAFGPVPPAASLEALVAETRRLGSETDRTIVVSDRGSYVERVHASPLRGREKDLLAVLLVCNSQLELNLVTGTIGNLALIGGLLVVPLGFSARWWTKRRLTRPSQRLSEGFRQVGSGNWRFRVRLHSEDEIGQLGHAFNRMTRKLASRSDKGNQAERVAAWRELTKQLAFHLRAPLSSMQAATEHLTQEALQGSRHLDKIHEASGTLQSRLTSLQAMTRCLEEFSSMPIAQLFLVDVNDLVSRMLQELDGQLRTVNPPIHTEVILARDVPKVMADPELLQRLLQGLALNAMDSMPEGGVVTVQTQRTETGAAISISDHGRGWSPDEMKELFIGDNLAEPEGAGWGIAIVQSVVSDMDGHVSVESTPGKGTRIRIELPAIGSSS